MNFLVLWALPLRCLYAEIDLESLAGNAGGFDAGEDPLLDLIQETSSPVPEKFYWAATLHFYACGGIDLNHVFEGSGGFEVGEDPILNIYNVVEETTLPGPGLILTSPGPTSMTFEDLIIQPELQPLPDAKIQEKDDDGASNLHDDLIAITRLLERSGHSLGARLASHYHGLEAVDNVQATEQPNGTRRGIRCAG
ncbi:hypothetical protein FOZ62_028916 [Perkinsus olseni]|uniref:Uncharacterized protein n=1 Tax=Perkinsus olseni TaxID=32597 RepID=A0A7J6QUS5_PEROL|nr:hypothetical protein FOZ62_028916 [Perkinsus olseni]